MSVLPGSRFGSYEIVAILGAGGMGEVYRARDTELKREVALKVLPPAFVADADRLARFRREAEILASLNHPNIAQVYGLEKADGQTAIVMELVEGLTLADRIEAGPIPPDEAMAIAFQVVAALEAAHEKGIVHRDLKPANIKVREDGTAKVLDFGISKPIDPKRMSGGTPVGTTPAMTKTGVILGTAAYMSPEQARGRFVDERTDIWAFGCLLFEMLTAQPAFGGEDMMAILARVIDRDSDLSSIPKTISPAVRHTIRLCLEKDARKRIADIRDVRLALEGKFESDLPREAAVAAGPRWRSVLLPATFAAAAAALITALVVSALDTGTSLSDDLIRRSSQTVGFTYTIPPGQELDTQTYTQFAAAPDGKEIVYVDRVSGELNRLRMEAADRPLAVPGPRGSPKLQPRYSPDAGTIMYGDARPASNVQLWSVPIDGGTPRALSTIVSNRGWSWGSDGYIYYGMDDTCEFLRVPATGGEPEPLGMKTGECASVALLPGGEKLIFSYYPSGSELGTSAGSVAVYDLAKRELTSLFPGKQPYFIEPGYLAYFDAATGILVRAFDPAAPEAAGEPVKLIDDVMQSAGNGTAQFNVSPTGTLVYVREDRLRPEAAQGGGRVLVVINSEGEIERQLDLPPAAYMNPSVSPDASQLAVQVGNADAAEIWVYPMVGGAEPRSLTQSGGATPSWSPDGESVVYSTPFDGFSVIWSQRVDLSGRPEQLTSPQPNRLQIFPRYEPDGRLTYTSAPTTDIVSAAATAVTMLQLDGGATQPIGNGERIWLASDFSERRGLVAFGELIPAAGDVNVSAHISRYPDFSVSVRISQAADFASWPVISRDDDQIAFQVDGRMEIVYVNDDLQISNRRTLDFELDGGRQGRLFESLPEGKWLVSLPVDEVVEAPAEAAVQQIVVVWNWTAEIEKRVPRE